MGNKAEIRCRILITEGSYGRSHLQQSGNCTLRLLGQFPVLAEGHVAAVLHKTHMNVHSGTGLAGRNLGSETDVKPVLECKIPDHPFGQQQLVGGCLDRIRQELYLVLLINFSVQSKVTNFPVFATWSIHARRKSFSFAKGSLS